MHKTISMPRLPETADGPQLSYNGDKNSVDMVIVFDKPVETKLSNEAYDFIPTNLTLESDGDQTR